MVKLTEFDLEYIDEAPSQERRRDLRIKNHKTREEAAHVRKLRQGRVRPTKVEWNNGD